MEGYCTNLSRTSVLGELDETQRRLQPTYAEMVEATRQMVRPDVNGKDLDTRGKKVCTAHSLGEAHIEGIGHGIGLPFE
jgi:Xaa-Pro aminopeptidase